MVHVDRRGTGWRIDPGTLWQYRTLPVLADSASPSVALLFNTGAALLLDGGLIAASIQSEMCRSWKMVGCGASGTVRGLGRRPVVGMGLARRLNASGGSFWGPTNVRQKLQPDSRSMRGPHHRHTCRPSSNRSDE